MRSKTVIINGVLYDRTTGMPLGVSETSSELHARTNNPAKTIHSRVKKSTTLNRKYVKQPQKQSKKTQTARPHQAPTTPSRQPKHTVAKKTTDTPATPSVTQSEHIAKFAPKTRQASAPQRTAQQSAPRTTGKNIDGVRSVPAKKPSSAHTAVATKAQHPTQHMAAKSAVTPSSVLLKQEVSKALHESDATPRQPHPKKHKKTASRKAKLATIGSFAAVFIMLGGYFTYLNVPNISTRIAASQVGIDARYPNYHPIGYSLDGSVVASNDTVRMNFKMNGGNEAYTLSQQRSTWDSVAVLDNVITPEVGTDYTTTEKRGMKIYLHQNGAAWVNKGILYTIDGSAPLTQDQVERIALSM